ncbi:hypothetical protein QCA50_020052 [Cerrena zonata]|uniref:Uncharacterized protein n=1 Tax=Cerrena zonata TaxID=2478898 RepID=A0AAW0F9Q5_9APHY
MCQFWVNFLKRLLGMPDHLRLPDGVEFKRGIGLFHVHGHVKECFARYGPHLHPRCRNARRGESLKHLELAELYGSSARAMSWFHRQEYLDAHMADSNLGKKLIGMVLSIFRKWENAVEQAAESEEDFVSLCASVGQQKCDLWD